MNTLFLGRNTFHTIAYLIAVLAMAYTSLLNAAQVVTPSEQIQFVEAGNTVDINVNYDISSPETSNEVGLGLRVHFDSSQISFVEINSALNNALQPIGSVQDDFFNDDNDADTDRFFIVAWIDYTGNWPGNISLPSSLVNTRFLSSQAFADSTSINFTVSSTSGDANFESTSQLLCRKPEAYIDAVNNLYDEGSTINFDIRLDVALPLECGAIEINYEISGTASEGADYEAIANSVTMPAGQKVTSISLKTINDTEVEDDKTITLSLLSSTSNTVNAGSGSQSTTLVSDDSDVSIAVSDSQLSENSANNTATITISRNGNLDNALTVNFESSGTATLGQDVNLTQTNSITIPSNQASATFTLNVINDTNAEDTETFTINLLSSNNYQLSENNSISLSIVDNDEICVDIDGNGKVDALTDGLTLTRYLIGLRGDSLIQNTLAVDATRTTSEEVTNFIEGQLPSTCYDIDGNNKNDALTDGLLLIRYLVGFRGNDLINGVLSNDATRTSGDAIAAYIESII